ncbi:MAG: HDOD domain-containing protein [Spongiibacteraceae bacterium]|jgi:HD-like signal output (HDOD) protein|nr:HDOD domain-containing protein [Spongiibacteraceae bacterium]
MNEVSEQIRAELLEALENDQLVLPTLPEVALQVRETAADPYVDIPKLTSVIQSDTALTARLIKVANSPLLRASRPIEDLKMAVGRLGINYTSNLATSLAMEQMFQATSDVIDQRMRAAWSRSTEVAAIAHVLARHYTRLKPDQATLAGIVHRIGVLPILTFAENNRRLLRDSDALDALIEDLHPRIGRRILQSWDFPAELQLIPEEHLNFARAPATVDYADVVMVAYLQSLLDTGHPLTQMDWSQVSAFDRLGLAPEVHSADDEDLSAEMEAAMALLNGD